MAVKNPTIWFPPNGKGYVSIVGLLKFQDNLGNLLIDNLKNNIVTNPVQVTPKNVTSWSLSGA